MAGSYLYHPTMPGYGQTGAAVASLVGVLAQVSLTGYKFYTDRITAIQQGHAVERAAANNAQAAADQAAAATANVIAAQINQQAQEAQFQAEGGSVGGVPTWVWVAGGAGALGLVALVALRKKR